LPNRGLLEEREEGEEPEARKDPEVMAARALEKSVEVDLRGLDC